MANYLLLGAGFSRNWGGWLAQELRGELLGHLSRLPEIYTALRANPSFEEVLSDFQSNADIERGANAKENLKAFQAAIIEAAISFEARVQAVIDKYRAIQRSLARLVPTERRVEQEMI